MSQTPIIICAPEFLVPLRKAYPAVNISSYTDDIKVCQEAITALDDLDGKHVRILYRSDQVLGDNQPVKDHVNLSKKNTLIGPADLSKGPRFPDMSSVYEAENGIIAVLGEDEDLKKFNEDWVHVSGGVWEAIALKHRGYQIEAWIIADLEKWISSHNI